MRKAAILIRASTEKKNAIMEKALLDYVEKAQIEVVSGILIETSQNMVMDQHINDILQEEIDVLIMREGTILTSKQQEKLGKRHIEIQEVAVQSQEQELSSIQQFQA